MNGAQCVVLVLSAAALAAANFQCSSSLYYTLRGAGRFDCSAITQTTSTKGTPQHLGVVLNSSYTMTVIGYGFLQPQGTSFSIRQQLYDDEWALLESSICDTNFTDPYIAPSPFAKGTKVETEDAHKSAIDKDAAFDPAHDVARGPLATVNGYTCLLQKPLVLNHGVYYLDTYYAYQKGGSYFVPTQAYTTWYTGSAEDRYPSPTVLHSATYTSGDFPAFALLSGFAITPSAPLNPNGQSCSYSAQCSSTCCCRTSASSLCGGVSSCTDFNGRCI